MNYTDEQITLAFDKLPRGVQDVVFSPGIEQKVQKICTEAGFNADQAKKLTGLVNFVIMDLTSQQEFSTSAEKELSITSEIANRLSVDVSREIFASIEAMETQSKKEEKIYEINSLNEEGEASISEESIPEIPDIKTIKAPDVAPDNLPTDEEGESLLPPIPLKFGAEGVSAPAHPFEEKMKKVFTAGQQSLGDLAIEPPSQTSSPTQAPKAPPIFHADPYREPIE